MSHSYDELLRQVTALKSENCKLRQELQDNSSHLTKLENEASNMKDVLTHLHDSMQDDLDLDRDECDLTTSLDHNSNDERNSDPGVVRIPSKPAVDNRMNASTGQKSQNNSPGGSPSKRRSQDKEIYTYMDDLNRERNSILQDIEQENKHRKRYFEQLDTLTKKLENLQLTEEMDMSRRQLEYEAQRLQERMQNEIGAAEQIQRRHEARLQRIRAIETEMLRLQQKHREQDQSDRKRQSSGSAADRSKMSDACTETEPLPPSSQECDSSSPNSLPTIYHGAWPIENVQMRHSVPGPYNQETSSVMSFNSSNGSLNSRGNKPVHHQQQQQLGTKVEMVYSLLSMLGTHDKDDMSRTLLAMSSSQDSCVAMRQSGCLPLLIQLLHGNDKDSGLLGNTRGSKPARARAAAALHNIVHSHPDDKRGRREARVLRLLEQIRAHCDKLREPDSDEEDNDGDGKRSRPGSAASKSADIDHHPGPAIAALMKLSFDEEHRHAICTLGGLQAIAELLQVDTDSHGNTTEQYNVTMRRYACMALTNLTFGDGTNKALLCSMKMCLRAIVLQLLSPNEDLCQVAASVLRNLSWRADLASKKMLREVDTVSVLMEAALAVKKESTLKSILSALWNLSAHCSENKADICAVPGALAFLVSTLTYKSPSKTLAIIENGGGILRNVSSHIAIREDYRDVLRNHSCLQMLLKHLRSPSLTIVSNACGTLWNLSARCSEDQTALWELGAVSMLRNLVHSKHKMISMGSAAALKNLLAAKPNISLDGDKPKIGLHVRKQKALEAELDQNLAETCENLESPQPSPVEVRKTESQRYTFNGETSGVYQVADSERHSRPVMRPFFYRNTLSGDNSPVVENKFRSPVRSVSRSGSQDSVGSVHSDISHDRTRVNSMLARSSKLLQSASFERRRDGTYQRFNHGDSLERKPSRIERIMQEVAIHAGIDGAPSAFSAPGGGDNTLNNAKQNHAGDNKNLSVEKYSNLHQKMENLNLNDSESNEEQPLNFSMKYAPAEPTVPNNQNNRVPVSGGNPRPIPKIGNYVGGPVTGKPPYGLSPHGSPMMQRSYERKECNIKNVHGNAVPKFSGYRETDIDTMDEQPTNYSLQFSEQDEPTRNLEEPINYSVRYREPPSSCADCKIQSRHVHSSRSFEDQNDLYGDTVKTFYTEGTPLNYMSTATSISDLSAKPNGSESRPDERLEEVNEDSQIPAEDEVKNFSTRYPESEKLSGSGSQQTGSTVVSTTNNSEKNVQGMNKEVGQVNQIKPEERDVSSGPLYTYDDSAMHSPRDKPVTYGVEGTPTCFSRVSSLSSLHTNEGEEANDNKPSVNSVAQERSYTPPIVPGDKMPPTDVGYDRDQKTVTFDENNHVQETPLMFSRCSSLGSLSSCEAHSIHSSIPSEYSTRRTSEVVSPSDLPDSPSETMPPSPKRKEAPVKFDNIRDNKMPVKVAVPKPVATVPQKQLAPSAGTPKKVPAPAVVLAGMFRETPVSYAVEDSPVNYSHASSLSALTIDDEPKISKDLTMKYQTKAESPAPKASVPIPEEQENSSLSEGDEDMLIECINSGMPASSKKKMKRSQSDNVIKKKSSSSQSKLNQISRGSRLPSRMNNKPGFGSAPTNFAPKPVGISSTPPRSSMPKIVSPRSTGMSPHAHLGHAPHSRTPPPPARAHQPSPTHKSQSLPRGVSSGLPRPSSASKLSHSSSANSMRRTSSGNPAHLYSNNDDYAQDSIKKFSSTELPYTRHSPRHEEYAHDSVKKYSPIELPTRIRQSPPQHDDYAEDSVKKFSTAEIPRVQQSPRNVPRPASQRPNFYNHDDFLLQDTVKTFATEGTPLNFSTATSLSDLSAIVDDNKYEPPAETNNATDRKPSVAAAPLPKESGKENAVSDTSSMSDGEDLLSEIIQSAMPKKVTSTKRRSAEGAENKEVKVVAAPPVDKKPVPAAVVSAWQFQPQRTSSMNSRPSLTQEDQVKTYMTEGTPINFSTATSLSDLTVDDSLDVGTKLTLPISKPLNNVQNSANNAATYRSAHDDSVFVQSHSYDSPRVYAVEGTPFSISRQDSLSSLSCDEEGGVEKVKPLSKKVTPNTDYKPSGFTPPKTFSPTKKPENQTVAHLAGHHRKQAESPNQVTTHATVDYSEHKNMDEQPKNFAVEGTPMCFSRNSSLSSLNSDEHEAMATSNISTNERSQMEQKDQRAKFKEEGTPVTFSRNSSLSSLSIISMESMSYDPTPTEQALLDQCISSAMPKKVTPTKPPNSMIGKPAKSGSFSGDRSKLLSVQRPQPSSKPSALKQVKYQSPENSSPKRTTDGTVKMNLLQRTASPRGTPKKESEIKTEVVSDCSLRPYPVVAVAANVQADNLPSQDTNGNAHLEVWRKAPHKSFDETISKNVEGEGRFGWRRAHSQDSDAFLKQRKDSTNHAKIQEKLASPEEKLEWRKTYTVPTEKAFLNNTEVVDKPDTFAVDNRVLDQHLKSPDSCEKGVLETGREKPPSPETERMNAVSASEDSARSEASEISTESALTMQDLMPRVVNDFDLMDSDYEVGDITQETLPVLSGFTSMETSVSSMGRSMHSMTKSGELLDQPSHAVQTPAKENHVDGYTTPEMSEDKDDLGLGMSPEEVQALEEAANMVVTSIKRDMSCSTLDDDMFIDNETLSLVSTEYASDTGSELSLTMSSSSKASDHFSELSSSSAVVRRGPRILKPGEKSTLTAKSEEESARGIRGKRKGLYSVKSVTKPANKPKETPPKVAPRAVVAKPVVKPGTPKTNTGSMATPGSKKPVARTTVTGNAVKTPPKTQPKPVAKKASPPSDTTKTTPPALGSRSNTVIRKTPVEKPAVRPKPPTKQGTFVKEAATSQNTPIIDVDQNGNRTSDDSSCEGDQTKPGRSSPPGGRQKPGLKKANNGTPQKQAPQTWSKALGGFNFVVDTSQDDCNKPEQSMQRQKSATQIGSTGARRTGNASPRSAANKTSANRTGSVTGSGSALNKTGSGSSLNKAGSGSSLNKSGSAGTRTALTKGSSASNLKKAGSKTSLKQSDSNASLKKSGSRSSTPTGRDTPPSDSGRRSSTDSSPGKKTSTAGIVGKKQVNSKIAGLWKKDDGAQSPVGKTGSTAGRAASPQTTGKKAPGSPNTSRRSSTPTRGVRAPMRSGSPASRPPPAPPVRKSSLSSNSSTSSIGGTTSSKSSASDGKKTTTEKKKPETLSRGKTFDKISRPSTPNKNNSPVKASANSWRKGKASAAKNQAGSPEVWVKRDSSTDSLSRTADSVSSLASASSEASLTLLNDRLSDSNTSVQAENNSTVNAKLKKEESIKSSINSTTKTKPVPKSGTKPSTPPKPLNSKLPNGQVKTEQKPTESQKTVRSPPLSPTLNQSRKIQPNDNRNNAEPLSAIVQPFNYNPNQVKNNSNQEVALKNAVNTSSQPESPKPMTKTEMLLARRRQSCKKPEEPKPAEDDEAKKAGCLVTTV